MQFWNCCGNAFFFLLLGETCKIESAPVSFQCYIWELSVPDQKDARRVLTDLSPLQSFYVRREDVTEMQKSFWFNWRSYLFHFLINSLLSYHLAKLIKPLLEVLHVNGFTPRVKLYLPVCIIFGEVWEELLQSNDTNTTPPMYDHCEN